MVLSAYRYLFSWYPDTKGELRVPAIGLQYKFKSLQWLSTVPPLVIVIIFKIFLKFKFDAAFDHYIPTEDELVHAKVHSQNADARGDRLRHRFGHPALHSDLFRPMLHARMMPLLAEIYKGKVHHEKTRSAIKDQTGKQLDTQVVDGIQIAYIEQVRPYSSTPSPHIMLTGL